MLLSAPDVHPINIPILEFRGNQAHSNGKYGLRVFDEFLPNEPSVIRDLFVWRNGMVGWTATKVGKLGLDGNLFSVNTSSCGASSRDSHLCLRISSNLMRELLGQAW